MVGYVKNEGACVLPDHLFVRSDLTEQPSRRITDQVVSVRQFLSGAAEIRNQQMHRVDVLPHDFPCLWIDLQRSRRQETGAVFVVSLRIVDSPVKAVVENRDVAVATDADIVLMSQQVFRTPLPLPATSRSPWSLWRKSGQTLQYIFRWR